MKPLPFREVTRKLETAGFTAQGQTGSHVKFAKTMPPVLVRRQCRNTMKLRRARFAASCAKQVSVRTSSTRSKTPNHGGDKTIGCVETTPFPSWIVIEWLALISEIVSLRPPGQITSMLATFSALPNPKVNGNSLCEQ